LQSSVWQSRNRKRSPWLSSPDLPVKLIAFPEGALQGFNDEVLDLDHVQFARECAIDIPGEETEALGSDGARV
jgi:beta-ureidopropionase